MPPKDFNLNEALSGAKLRTRDGFPVTIYTFARRFPAYPIVGVINYPAGTGDKIAPCPRE